MDKCLVNAVPAAARAAHAACAGESQFVHHFFEKIYAAGASTQHSVDLSGKAPPLAPTLEAESERLERHV